MTGSCLMADSGFSTYGGAFSLVSFAYFPAQPPMFDIVKI